MNRKYTILILLTAYVLLITVMMLVKFSPDVEVVEIPNLDKLVHFCIYLGMNTLVLLFAEIFNYKKGALLIVISTITVLLYSILIEYIQPFFGRSSEVKDVFANALGAITGIPVYLLISSSKFIKYLK